MQTIQATDVRKGDRLGSSPTMITDVTIGTKYVTVQTSQGKRRLAAVGEEVVVTRDELTDDERAAEDRLQNETGLSLSAERALDEAVQSFGKVDETAARLVIEARWRVDMQWSCLNAHLKAMAVRDLWGQVIDLTGRDGRTFVQAVLVIVGETRKALVTNRWRGSSSDAVSNATASIEREVASEWVQSWYVSSIEHYAAALGVTA
jgi:hypothetical protein